MARAKSLSRPASFTATPSRPGSRRTARRPGTLTVRPPGLVGIRRRERTGDACRPHRLSRIRRGLSLVWRSGGVFEQQDLRRAAAQRHYRPGQGDERTELSLLGSGALLHGAWNDMPRPPVAANRARDEWRLPGMPIRVPARRGLGAGRRRASLSQSLQAVTLPKGVLARTGTHVWPRSPLSSPPNRMATTCPAMWFRQRTGRPTFRWAPCSSAPRTS